MDYMKIFMSLFLLYVLGSEKALAQIEDDNCYAATFTEGVTDCDGFENEFLVCLLNIDLSPGSDDTDSGLDLSGEMRLKEDIDDSYEIDLKVWKDIGSGKQYMYSFEANLCESINKNDTPWQSVIDTLQTNECPIIKGVYPVKDMMISLEFAQGVLCHEFCGDYLVQLSILTVGKRVSCHEVGVSIAEVPC